MSPTMPPNKSRKAEVPAAHSPLSAEAPVTLNDFRTAVRYLLITDHGMPAMVADEVIKLDDPYLQRIFGEGGSDGASPMEAAEELAIKPSSEKSWVKLGDDQVVIRASGYINQYVDQLVGTGLFGDDRTQVVDAMVRRGIESVLPVLQLSPSPKRNR